MNSQQVHEKTHTISQQKNTNQNHTEIDNTSCLLKQPLKERKKEMLEEEVEQTGSPCAL